jgi:hypothetical protein
MATEGLVAGGGAAAFEAVGQDKAAFTRHRFSFGLSPSGTEKASLARGFRGTGVSGILFLTPYLQDIKSGA